MKVSLITTCYNRVHSIQDTIESVLNQDYDNIEYIIIDGASTDGCVDIFNSYKGRISTLVSEPDTGIYNAINKGIQLATGDIVGVLHSDDVFFSNHVISSIVSAFQQNEADLVYGNGLFVNLKTQRIVRNWVSGNFRPNKILRGWLPLHPTVYIRRVLIEKHGLYDESYKISADSEFLLRYIHGLHLTIYYINEYFVRMGMGGASTSFSQTLLKWKEDKRVYQQHGLKPYWLALSGKILSKIPQFITAMFI
jgi:glycosyltransferase